MSFRKPDGPLTVHVPSAAEDRPSWPGVAAIAVVGFAVGVAWPRLAGVRLGPGVPDGPVASASGEPVAPTASGVPGPAAPMPAVPAALPVPAASAAPVAAAAVIAHVSVGRGAIFACKTPDGDALKGPECGALQGLDPLVQPRLQKLADCPEAADASGTLHLIVRADFARDALSVNLGREKGVASSAPLLACAKSALAPVSLKGLTHDNARYSVAYSVKFGGGSPASSAPESPAPSPAPPSPVATDGTAQVEYQVGIVRDAPRASGRVLARLTHGTALHVGAPKDGWYPVQYGDGFSSSGWLFHGAIGR